VLQTIDDGMTEIRVSDTALDAARSRRIQSAPRSSVIAISSIRAARYGCGASVCVVRVGDVRGASRV